MTHDRKQQGRTRLLVQERRDCGGRFENAGLQCSLLLTIGNTQDFFE